MEAYPTTRLKTSAKPVAAAHYNTTNSVFVNELPNNITENIVTENITLIVDLRGELGNQLSLLAGARLTQRYLERVDVETSTSSPHVQRSRFRVQLVAQHQDHPTKWAKTRDELIQCFPNLRSLNFESGVWDPSFEEVRLRQKALLEEVFGAGKNATVAAKELVDLCDWKGLSVLTKLQQYQQEHNQERNQSVTFSVPYLRAHTFHWKEFLEEQELYDDLRDWFRFDSAACCAMVPDTNEVVYHHRNFVAELGVERTAHNEYAEVTPETAAKRLFNNTTTPRVAIVSWRSTGLEPYLDALHKEGIAARVVTGQSGVQDFCFVKEAKQELVGSYQSTFLRWASFLSNATVNRFYKLDLSPSVDKNSSNSSRTTHMDVFANKLERNGRAFYFESYWQPDEERRYP